MNITDNQREALAIIRECDWESAAWKAEATGRYLEVSARLYDAMQIASLLAVELSTIPHSPQPDPATTAPHVQGE